MPFIEVLTVEDHEKYVGRKAVLHGLDASLFVDIVKTSRVSATVKHPDGSLQKAMWSKLSVEMEK
jgi:hypothetical protein